MTPKAAKEKQKASSGFIALMSAIIISVILLLITTNLNLTGFYNRSNILDWELKEKSSAVAEGCADLVLLRLASDSGYAGGENIAVSGSDTCHIFPALAASNPRMFTIQAQPANYYTNLEITVDVPTLVVTKWEEI
jgi:purine-cytosine permease-like protein